MVEVLMESFGEVQGKIKDEVEEVVRRFGEEVKIGK